MRAVLLSLLGRLSVGRKLMLIFMLDMTAVAFISGILVNEKFIAIDFARKELAGRAYIDGLRAPLVALMRDREARAEPALRQAEAQQVLALQQQLGNGLDSQAQAQGLAEQLQLAAAAGADVQAEQRAATLAAARALLTRIGNQSNLILDPDLDSYYTMSIVLLRAPELLDSVAAISAHLRQRDPAQPLSQAWRARYLMLEGQLDSVAKGLASDYSEALAASATTTLAQRLAPSREALMAAVAAYRVAARQMAEDAAPALNALDRAHPQLVVALDAAWREAGAALEGLLQARIHGFFVRMAWHLGTALLLLALILCAVAFVARQIALPLRRLLAVADAVRLTGDHSRRAQWHSQDEIGRLVAGFNDMLAQLDQQRGVQQALAAQTASAEAQRQLVEAIPIPLMVTAVPGHQVLHANGPAQQWLGDGLNDPWRAGLEAPVRARFFQQLHDRDAVSEFEVHWHGATGATWAVLSARRLHYQGQDAVLTALAPINHLKLMERRLELWAKVFEASSEGIVIIDAQRQVLTVNRAFSQLSHYQLPEVVGQPLACLDGGALPGAAALMDHLWPLVLQRGSWQGEVVLQRRDGVAVPTWLMVSAVRDRQQGELSHCIATLIDISERKRQEERIRFLAQHDVLTELPNRALCLERLAGAVQRAERSGDKVAVLFIDLDHFKTINDSLGHHVGDALLRSVAQRISGAVRGGDTVSRLGGDEFVVVLHSVASADEIQTLVHDRLVPRVRQPHLVDGAELHVSCSVGIAVYPDDAQDIDTLMRHADAAMYAAKGQGRDGAQFFTAELNDRAQRRLQVESRLRHAVARDELLLHYQPRVDARTGRLVGVEALLRWQSGDLGPMAPAGFVPLAEESGLIVPIGAWVIDQACRQHALWRAQGLNVPQVSVNVSAVQLRDGQLPQVLDEAMRRHGCPSDALEVELTESSLMSHAEHILSQLHAIKRLGIALSVDDFGTGYSSLAYLHRFPIDRLKVDRSFIADLTDDPAHLAISRAIIGLGHALGLRVVAEGVETEAQADCLRANGCDELQGYLYGRPMTAEALVAWMDDRARRRA